MANIQQVYTPGELFNVYTADQLSTLDWKWEHRTLSGLRDENGTFIPFGSEISIASSAATLSGVWTLDRDRHVRIYLKGEPGILTATVTTIGYSQPNANPLPLSALSETYTVSSDADEYESVVSAYYATHVSVDISVDPAYQIKNVLTADWKTDLKYADLKYADTKSQYTWTSHRDNGGRECAISVEYVKGGVLDYEPNTGVEDPYQA